MYDEKEERIEILELRVANLEQEVEKLRRERYSDTESLLRKTEDFFNESVAPVLTQCRVELDTRYKQLQTLVGIIQEDLPTDCRLYVELYKMGLINDDKTKNEDK